ncbi:MAG TPA: alpha/beta fold hydrolase [Devosia sp.]|nr:alpha/beta fold hydrolase [Devosia sp.]
MTAVTPFTIAIPDAEVDDLRARLAAARMPRPAPVSDWSRGVPNDYLAGLTAYWRDGYDWRKAEAGLNRFPHFTTVTDGQTMHFVHVRSANPDATAIVLCHGWPGSFVEFDRIIGPLSEMFHVVVPSLPGFGFSVPLSSPGWGLTRATHAYAAIMERLGYDRYIAHGSDIGSGIAGHLGALYPDRVIGIHTAIEKALATFFGLFLPLPDTLSDAERAAIDAIKAENADGDGYMRQQATRPQTVAFGLADSPIGQLAWIVEKFRQSARPGQPLPEETADRDQLLTNVSLYWFTNTAGSSAQFYYEGEHSKGGWAAPSPAPTATSVFDAAPVIRRVLDPNHQATQWTEHAEGGHFPAMEVPHLLAADILAFGRLLRARMAA